MRILHIVSSNRWGGVERYTLDICRGLATQGHSVTVYTRDARAVDEPFRQEGVDIRHLPLVAPYNFASAWMLSRHLCHESKNIVIHTHRFSDAFTALLARKLSGRSDIRVVTTRHCAMPGKNSMLYRRIYRNLDAIIFVSRIARESFICSWARGKLPFPPARMHVIHNSIYLPGITPQPLPESGPVIAMFHGRLSAEKGVETLIDALPALKGKRTRLWIVGTGDPDYVDSLKRHAISIGVMDMIDWKGHVSNVHELIPLSHFGVLPSVWAEPFGLANIEYMAHGRAQICTDNGAQTEYMTPGNEAIMIPPGNAEALSEAIVSMVSNPDMRKRMGNHAATTFSSSLQWEYFLQNIINIYRSSPKTDKLHSLSATK